MIDLGDGNERLMAEIFPHSAGIVFADIGWPEATWHPFHLVEGELTGDGPWEIAGHEIRFAFDGEQLYADWARWLEYRRGEGSRFNREQVRNQLVDALLLAA